MVGEPTSCCRPAAMNPLSLSLILLELPNASHKCLPHRTQDTAFTRAAASTLRRHTDSTEGLSL